MMTDALKCEFSDFAARLTKYSNAQWATFTLKVLTHGIQPDAVHPVARHPSLLASPIWRRNTPIFFWKPSFHPATPELSLRWPETTARPKCPH